jgi:hypothetical protein
VPNLALHEIARTPNHSVRPDLWPAYAWMPVLGCQGASVYDVVGQQHGVLSGNPTWDNNSIQFNGAGMVYVGLQRILPTGEQPFTVSTRVRVAPGQSGEGCCWTTNMSSTYDAFLFAYRASSSGRTRLFWRNQGGEVYVGSDIRGAGWCVLTMVYDGSTCKQYINGIYDTQGPANAASSGIWAGFAIGAAVRSGLPRIRFQLTGHLDFTHIWPRDLLASEVAEHARDPLLPFRRRQPRRYFISSAEPPSFNSAWATGNNHIIGAA